MFVKVYHFPRLGRKLPSTAWGVGTPQQARWLGGGLGMARRSQRGGGGVAGEKNFQYQNEGLLQQF